MVCSRSNLRQYARQSTLRSASLCPLHHSQSFFGLRVCRGNLPTSTKTTVPRTTGALSHP
jgi:hypothetical protein